MLAAFFSHHQKFEIEFEQTKKGLLQDGRFFLCLIQDGRFFGFFIQDGRFFCFLLKMVVKK